MLGGQRCEGLVRVSPGWLPQHLGGRDTPALPDASLTTCPGTWSSLQAVVFVC